MVFENISFNEEFWKTKSEAEFIAGESHHGLSKDQLRETYAIINPQPVVEKDQPVDTGSADESAE